MQLKIEFIEDPNIKKVIAEKILFSLPEWFGNEKANQEYLENIKYLPFISVFIDDGNAIGFASIKIHHRKTGDIYLIGVKPEYHGFGIGSSLIFKVEEYCKIQGCLHVIVKTLSEESKYEPYLKTIKFYRSLGYEELITFDEFWDKENKCLLMIKSI